MGQVKDPTHDQQNLAPPVRTQVEYAESLPAENTGNQTSARPALLDLQREPTPLGWRGILSVVALVILCDATIYHGNGYAGPALLFLLAPVLLMLGSNGRRCWSTWLVAAMLVVLSVKLVWCGSGYLVAIGVALLVALATTLAGLRPYVLDVAVFASQTPLAGCIGLVHQGRTIGKIRGTLPSKTWLSIVLPVAALVVFGMIFTLANPDLSKFFGDGIERFFRTLQNWVIDFSPRPLEWIFWIAVAWIAVGLLRPIVGRALLTETPSAVHTQTGKSQTSQQTVLYPAFRNTLIAVNALFAVYLVFEFKTLWFRVFPEGFYYSGYAHEGAAWLTLALAIATVVLSLIFRGRVLDDSRLPKLRYLAWLWSFQNVVLAVAVYNRMSIYIGFNGLTRMRIVGIFGISAVVVGFILVLWKLARNRDFIWLVHRQLWTVALAVFLLAITPIDTLVVRYNVSRIMSGDPAPSVQISVHAISSEGILLLRPLLNCKDETIREGVRAMLAERYEETEELARRRRELGWTAYQISDSIVHRSLQSSADRWTKYKDRDRREETLKRFHLYVYQWF